MGGGRAVTQTRSFMGEALRLLAERRDLPPEVAHGAMTELMEGRADGAQIGAFLMGLRAKGETVDELAGFARAMREKSVRLTPRLKGGALLTDVCGTGGAPVKTFNVSTIGAFVAAGAGVPVAKHGNRGVTSPSGSADVLEALGANLDAAPQLVQACLEELGVGFLFAPRFHPAMQHAAPVRRALGIRTVFNLLGPLTNPAGAQAHLMGVFAPHLVEIYPEVLKALGVKRALVVHGADGLDEFSTVGPTHVGELSEGRLRRYEAQPEEFGFKRATPDRVGGLPPEESARLARRLLKDELHDERYEMLILNSGAAIFAGGGATSLEAGLAKARESVRSGAAYGKLEQFIARTNS